MNLLVMLLSWHSMCCLEIQFDNSAFYFLQLFSEKNRLKIELIDERNFLQYLERPCHLPDSVCFVFVFIDRNRKWSKQGKK